MQLFISPKTATTHGRNALDETIKRFRVYPCSRRSRDGGLERGFRVALFASNGYFVRWV